MFGIIGTTILFVGAFFFISHLNRKNGGKIPKSSDWHSLSDAGLPDCYTDGTPRIPGDSNLMNPFKH